LVVLIGVAVALAVQSVVAYRRAREVEELLGRAQASALQKAMTPGMRMVRDREGLERMLEEHRDDGLRYVALLAPGPSVHAEAGVSAARATVLPERDGGPGAMSDVRVGTRWRVYSPMPPPGARRGPEGRPPGPPGGPPGMRGPDGGPPHRPGPPPFVVEVEPSAGGALRTEATRSLVLGLASAAALLGVTAWLVWWLRQREQLAARVAHDRRLAALGEMSAVMAHEIRNPLASLKGHAQLLVENLEGKDREQVKAQRVVDEAVRLERLTNDLLEFARTGRIERQPCDPAEVLRDAAGGFEGPRLVIETAGAPARWSLDAGRMRQVLANLIGNALEAAPAGEVTVSVEARDGTLVYRVRDRGPGLPAGDAARLFEPFHTTRAAGVGLGLAVAHRLVELHGGQLAARNHPGGGAELTVTIPEAR
jgi:two-component system sensor histidine kinase HydH